jgi:hypothetical protein
MPDRGGESAGARAFREEYEKALDRYAASDAQPES